MATHSNRPPSPISSRPINPKPRNSENNSSIRRSFSGNSPSDIARRKSVAKEGKENDEKDSVLNASKLQTPAKGCKNFMTPTISAASKFTPSPRKKVLVERHDPIRTSISLSDGRTMPFSAMLNASQDLESKSGITESTCLDSNLADIEIKKAVPRPCKKVVFTDIPLDSEHLSEPVGTDSDGLKMESTWIGIAPLDADPLLPPYDPKINYMSPRSQFICYKPNVRLLNKEKWLDPDDSLMAEIMCGGFSESDEGIDEPQKGEAEISASVDMVIGVDEVIEVDSHSAAYEEGFVQNNGKRRLMCFSLILTMLIASCVLIFATPSPLFDEVFFKDLSFSDINNLYQQSRLAVASARLSFGHHVNRVSDSSVAMLFKIANELGKGEKRTPVQFMNLSVLQDGTWNEDYFPSVTASLEQVESLQEDEFEEETDYASEEDENADEGVADTDLETFEEEEASKAEVDTNEEISSDYVKLAELELPDSESQAEVVSSINRNSADQLGAAFEHQESAATGVAVERQETEKSEAGMTTLLPQTSFGMIIPSSVFAGLVAVAAAFIYQYKRSHPRVEAVLRKQTHHQENWRTEFELSSSFQTSYSMVREADEVESSERKARQHSRRESLASSLGSPSYGSFTTYERLPTKSNANADEEVITPVRRSSRIRNHHSLA